MSTLYDIECSACGKTFEEFLHPMEVVPLCSFCGSAQTRKCMGGNKFVYKAKDPYDYLSKGPPSDKKIVSRVPSNYRSK